MSRKPAPRAKGQTQQEAAPQQDQPERLTTPLLVPLTDEEVILLTTTSDALLTSHDQQRKSLLQDWMKAIECPACLQLITKRAAMKRPAVPPPAQHEPGENKDLECPRCHASLQYCLGVFGYEWFRLNPGQTIFVGTGRIDSGQDHES